MEGARGPPALKGGIAGWRDRRCFGFNLNLTVDRRAADGAIAADFLGDLAARMIEGPGVLD